MYRNTIYKKYLNSNLNLNRIYKLLTYKLCFSKLYAYKNTIIKIEDAFAKIFGKLPFSIPTRLVVCFNVMCVFIVACMGVPFEFSASFTRSCVGVWPGPLGTRHAHASLRLHVSSSHSHVQLTLHVHTLGWLCMHAALHLLKRLKQRSKLKQAKAKIIWIFHIVRMDPKLKITK
jgi:hypothetical protein